MRLLLLLLAAVIVASCTEPPPEASDYRARFPVAVRAEAVTWSIPITAIADENAAAGMAAFAVSYRDRGHEPLTISARRTAHPAVLNTMRDRLVAAGVAASEIQMALDDRAVDTVTLAYDRYDVSSLECGDWTANSSFNPYNLTHSNFGCASQHNIGVMTADPADLTRSRNAATTDTQNATRVIEKFRTGQAPGGIPNPQQIQGAAGTSGGAK